MKTRFPRLLITAVSVIVLSFFILSAIVTAYAFVLAVQARGAPDQAAIGRFASKVSPRLMPWVEALLTLVLSMRFVKHTTGARNADGLLIGVLTGILCLAVPLTFRGHIGPRSLIVAACITAAGWLGGFWGRRCRPGA